MLVDIQYASWHSKSIKLAVSIYPVTTSIAIPYKLEAKIKSMDEAQLETFYFDMWEKLETAQGLEKNLAQMAINYIKHYYVV